MFEDLIYQIETLIADADKDPEGLMKMRKLVDILNSGSAAVASKRVQLLRRKAGHADDGWEEKILLYIGDMSNDLSQLKKLLNRDAGATL